MESKARQNVYAAKVAEWLFSTRFNWRSERELQRGIAQALTSGGFEFQPEVKLTKHDRVDFLVEKTVGLEVKIDGSLASVTRQLHRYAQLPEIDTLILVTTRSSHKSLPGEINGKPLYVVHLINSIL